MLVDPNLGKKNPEKEDVDTYCDVTGFTRSNGDKPNTESICKALNGGLVSFEKVAKNIDMDGYTITNLGNPTGGGQTLATQGYAFGHVLTNSIETNTLQPGLITINSSSDGFTTIELNEINNKAAIIL